MQQLARNVLTAFVFSTLALIGPSFDANAYIIGTSFTATPNQIDVGQSSTLFFAVAPVPFPPLSGEQTSFDKSASSVTLFSGIGPSVTIHGLALGDVNLLGALGIAAQTSFSYPDPGTFHPSYSFTLASVISCLNTICTTPQTETGSASIDLVVNSIPGVPGPIAGAGLPGLLLAGGGLFAWWRRKRKAKASA